MAKLLNFDGRIYYACDDAEDEKYVRAIIVSEVYMERELEENLRRRHCRRDEYEQFAIYRPRPRSFSADRGRR
jgi:hypothetical protein